MKSKFVVHQDPKSFKGFALATTQRNGRVLTARGEITMEHYRKIHGNDVVAVNYDEFDKVYLTPYLTDLQGKFVEITEEDYWEALEVLPPMKHSSYEDIGYFFIGEPTTYSLYGFYVKYNGKYYSALRDIHIRISDLYKQFKAQISGT